MVCKFNHMIYLNNALITVVIFTIIVDSKTTGAHGQYICKPAINYIQVQIKLGYQMIN